MVGTRFLDSCTSTVFVSWARLEDFLVRVCTMSHERLRESSDFGYWCFAFVECPSITMCAFDVFQYSDSSDLRGMMEFPRDESCSLLARLESMFVQAGQGESDRCRLLRSAQMAIDRTVWAIECRECVVDLGKLSI